MTTTAKVMSAETPASGVRAPSLPGQVVIITAGTFAIALFTFLVTRMYAQRYATDMVSALLVFRVYGTMLTAIPMMGMSFAVLRSVGALHHDPPRAARSAFAGLTIATVAVSVVCAVSVLFSEKITQWAHVPGFARLWSAFIAVVAVQACSNVAFYVRVAEG